MDIIVLLQQAVLNHASDIFVVAGLPVSYRANGRICREKEEKLMPPQTKECVEELYKLAGGRDIRVLEEKGDDDFSFAVPGLSRFRVSAYKQRGALSAVIRVITFELPEPNEIGIPDPVMSFYNLSKGLVLVTGPAGSGKSTTLACLVDKINHSMEKHIITLEDPIEYLHRHDKSIVSQREINVDTESYVNALRASLRQSPDVILLGEMRDYETIDVAMTAAETGHLVFSTLHTIGAENMYFEEKGAYTGEISPNMLTDAGVKYVVLGHSERREYFAETNETVNKKMLKAFEHGLTPIMCCGETLEQREQGVTMDFIRQQVKVGFQNVTADQAKTAVIAYEPIWAIGTGKTATTEQAQEVCKAIRECIAEVYDEATAEAIRIQYGGSVNAATAPELFAQPDIDGGLVGGASLKPDFGKIVNWK